MGRELKRVALDFDWPLHKVWPGYMVSFEALIEQYNSNATDEEREQLTIQFGRLMGCEIKGDDSYRYPDYAFLEPPDGEGYQLWETTTEGSPCSPIFTSLDELCAWCAENVTTFASYTATAEEWKQMLGDGGFVHHQEGNAIFL